MKKEFIRVMEETGLYVITDREMAGKPHDEIFRECVEGGAQIIQIRDKELLDREYYQQAQKCMNWHDKKHFIVINDRVDIAHLINADGVHLGQEDLPVSEARKLLGKKVIIGLSTHNEEQFIRALNEDVDYIAIGPVFATMTKLSTNQPLGMNYLERVRKMTDMPLVAIGGINLERACDIWNLGIEAVAVVSDIMKSASISNSIKQYLGRCVERR